MSAGDRVHSNEPQLGDIQVPDSDDRCVPCISSHQIVTSLSVNRERPNCKGSRISGAIYGHTMSVLNG